MKSTMRFPTFILKNVFRRPVRSLLTAVSMAIGVGAVVALVGISTRFEESFIEAYSTVGVDLIVVREGQAISGQSVLPESLGEKIRDLPNVKDVLPVLVDTLSFDDAALPIVPVQGLVPGSIVFQHLKLTEDARGRGGRAIAHDDERQVMLGSLLADNLDKKVGDSIELMEGETFEVAGVFHSKNFSENNIIIVRLLDLQKLMGREGQVTGYSIVATNPRNTEEITEIQRQVAKLEPNIKVVPAREHVESLTEVRLAKAMAWITSAVALIIGAVGMINTMVMSVNERIGEIGILRAIGWRRASVVTMVISEAVMLAIGGGILGSAGSLIVVRLLAKVPAAQRVIDGQIQPMIVCYGMAIAVIVGVIGGLLPAMRASHLHPTTALRYD